MALVREVLLSDDGLVRQVKLRAAYKQEYKFRFMLGPISQVVIMVGADDQVY